MALPSPNSPRRRKPVLVVEDAQDIRESIQEVLELDGYEVVTAANGAIAWEKLSRMALPCLVLLDLMMPVMDGFQFLEALHGSPRRGEVDVVIVSANNRLEVVAQRPHVVAYLRKPFELDALLELVDSHTLQ